MISREQLRERITGFLGEAFCPNPSVFSELAISHGTGLYPIIRTAQHKGAAVTFVIKPDELVKVMKFDIGLTLQITFLESTPGALFREINTSYGVGKSKEFVLYKDLGDGQTMALARGSSGEDRDVFITRATDEFYSLISTLSSLKKIPDNPPPPGTPEIERDLGFKMREFIATRAEGRRRKFEEKTINPIKYIAREFIRPFVMRSLAEQQFTLIK